MTMLQVNPLIWMPLISAGITASAEGPRRDHDSGSNGRIWNTFKSLSPYQMSMPTGSGVKPSVVEAQLAALPAFSGQELPDRYPQPNGPKLSPHSGFLNRGLELRLVPREVKALLVRLEMSLKCTETRRTRP